MIPKILQQHTTPQSNGSVNVSLNDFNRRMSISQSGSSILQVQRYEITTLIFNSLWHYFISLSVICYSVLYPLNNTPYNSGVRALETSEYEIHESINSYSTTLIRYPMY